MSDNRFPKKILIIDHDQMVVNQVATMLENRKIPVVKATSYDQALYHFNHNKIDLCIIEKEVESIPGVILIQKFRNHEIPSKRNPGFILSSNTKSDKDQHILRELGTSCVISKPIKEPALLSLIVKAMEEAYQRQTLHELSINVVEPMIEKGDFENAINIAETKLVNSGHKGQFMAAEINEKCEQFPRALNLANELYQSDKKNLQYVSQIARLHMRMGHLEDSRKFYEIADKLAPDNLQRVEEMASLYLKMKLPEKSIEKFKQLMRNNPEDPELKFKFLEELQKGGYLMEAKNFCKDTTGAIELIRHFNNRGVFYSKQNQFINAIDEYDKARKLIPNSKEIYRILYNMAIAHINLKSPDHLKKAEELLHECLKLKPEFPKAEEKLSLIAKYVKPSA